MKFLRRSKVYFFVGFALFLSSFIGKKPAEKSRNLQPYLLANRNDGLVYDASFAYKEFNASGLLVMKREQEGSYHVALLSKFGVALMEFKLTKGGIVWLKRMGEMDNKVFEKLVERDFRLLLLSELDMITKSKLVKESSGKKIYKVKGELRSRVWLDAESGKIFYTENKGVLNPFKSKVTFSYGSAQEFPAQIILNHRNIDMSVNMSLLKINYAEQ